MAEKGGEIKKLPFQPGEKGVLILESNKRTARLDRTSLNRDALGEEVIKTALLMHLVGKLIVGRRVERLDIAAGGPTANLANGKKGLGNRPIDTVGGVI